MFGFSLGKLLVLALIIGAVIVGYRLVGRLTDPGNGKGRSRPAAGNPEPDAFDTEYDAETDTYVVRDKNAKRD